MKVALQFAPELDPTTRLELEQLVAAINAGWRVNHDDQGNLIAEQGTLGGFTLGADALTGDGVSIESGASPKITFDNGTYMKVSGTGFGSTGQFIEWYGPHQDDLADCNEANAIFYLKTNGESYFGGVTRVSVTSHTVTESADMTTSALADLGPFTSAGGTITIRWTYDFKAGQAYPPTTAGLNAYNALGTKTDPAATLILSRKKGGGAFADVATLTISTVAYDAYAPVPAAGEPGYYFQTMSGSGTYTDPDLSTDNREFKLRIDSRTSNAVPVTKNTLTLTSTE